MRYRISSERFWYDINDDFGSSGGVYVLSCVDETGRVIPISRLLDDDMDGVLYIGMATSFTKRVIDLKKSLSPDHESKEHECGVRHKGHKHISKNFPYDRLEVELFSSEDPRILEHDLLESYFVKFGELPPLNRVC